MCDLRNDDTIRRRLAARGAEPVNVSKGKGAAKALAARKYVECSAFTQEGLSDAVETVVAAVLKDVRKGKEPVSREGEKEREVSV